MVASTFFLRTMPAVEQRKPRDASSSARGAVAAIIQAVSPASILARLRRRLRESRPSPAAPCQSRDAERAPQRATACFES